ncbi:DUF3575 domain-containing protein [Tamlana fucoidanivorans]|uniref:DUF3575 domain-containing protein n=1 Tax=Allotamlana fucoidanivorans TaxID=2583814 RepID=A0A5C4SR91_9FLAO|nr:DUF3575 domain-containing protein [Tamlana fucoidanivorans]TNJ46597.1 DUF3575 domain-containing protein [Tamlana fucoidanivorans]
MPNKCILTTIALTLTLSLFSQENTDVKKYKNEIGIVFTDLANGTGLLRYERLLNNHFSVALSAGYKTENGLISFRGIDANSIKTNDFNYFGYKLIPEVRYYFKNTMIGSMDGFYVGAYVKYSDFKSDLNGTYVSEDNTNYDVEYDADFKVTSIGLMAGYKLRLSKRFFIDFLIAGPGGGHYNFKLVQKKSLPTEFYEKLNNALSEYGIFDFINSDFEFKDVDLRSKFSTISFRYGITVGYSF